MSRAAWHRSERTLYLPAKQRCMSIEAGATHHSEVLIPPYVTPQSHSTSLNMTRAALACAASAMCKPRTRCRPHEPPAARREGWIAAQRCAATQRRQKAMSTDVDERTTRFSPMLPNSVWPSDEDEPASSKLSIESP